MCESDFRWRGGEHGKGKTAFPVEVVTEGVTDKVRFMLG